MYYLGSVIHLEKTIVLFDTGNYNKKLSIKYGEGRKMNKEYFLFVNGKKIKVSEEGYKVYW